MVLEGVIPANLHAEMFEAVKREDLRAARRVADRMYPVVQATYAEPFLDGHNRMKEALAILGRTRLLDSGLGKSNWDGGCSPRRAYETGSTTGLDGEPEKTCGGSPGPTKRSWSSATQPKPARPGTP